MATLMDVIRNLSRHLETATKATPYVTSNKLRLRRNVALDDPHFDEAALKKHKCAEVIAEVNRSKDVLSEI